MKLALAMMVAIAGVLGMLPANAQIVRCEGASGNAVYRNAGDCPQGKKRGEVVQVYTPPPTPAPVLTPQQAREQQNAAINAKTNADAKAAGERNLKAYQEMLDRIPTPKPLKFGPNAPGCGSGPGSPRC